MYGFFGVQFLSGKGIHTNNKQMYFRASGSEVATLINDYINRGAIVPVEITIGLIEKVLFT